jgi:hypothetical protein
MHRVSEPGFLTSVQVETFRQTVRLRRRKEWWRLRKTARTAALRPYHLPKQALTSNTRGHMGLGQPPWGSACQPALEEEGAAS